jgi:signal transduction histidine kinase
MSAAVLIGVFLSALGAAFPAVPDGTHPQKRVLVLQEFRRDTALASEMEDVYRQMLGGVLGSRLDYYSEYLDTARFADSAFRDSAIEYLRARYEPLHIDVVIATTTATLELVRSADGVMLGDAAVVFHGSTQLSGDARTTGVVSRLDFARTLQDALRVLPERSHVVVVGGSAPFDRGYLKVIRQQFAAIGPPTRITWLTDLSVSAVEATIRALPDDATVLWMSFTEDSAGQRFVSNELMEQLAATAPVPFLGVHEVQVGHGVIGGRLFSSRIVAERTAELTLRILAGESPADIQPVEIEPYVLRYDWRQLRRWNVAESALPAGADVVYREPGVWEAFRGYFIGGVLLMLVQFALIAGLLAQRASRRKAERVLQAGQAALRASNARSRELAGRLIAAQEAERTRLARDLHDDACQEIAGLSVELSRLKGDRTIARQPELRGALAMMQQRAARLAENVRLLSHDLHPTVLHQVGLGAAFESHGLEVRRLYGVGMDLHIDANVEPVSGAVRLALFRIGQEAIRNACLHGRARRVMLSLGRNNGHVALRVNDDGVGFDVDVARRGGGLGLVSMEERARLIKGEFSVTSVPGRGSDVEVLVPAQPVAS